MLHRVLADAVLVLHLAFVVFVVAGGLLALRWRWAPFVHLPAAAWGVFVELSGRLCPLTPLENALRRAAGEAGYAGGFADRRQRNARQAPSSTARRGATTAQSRSTCRPSGKRSTSCTRGCRLHA